MTIITVYDPAMCCSTGLCGTDVDQRLVDLAADLDWLKAQGISVRRFGLSREPAEFAAHDEVRRILQDSGGDDLPVFLVDGALKAKACYPARAELAEWAGVAAAPTLPAPKASSCCGGGAKALPVSEKAGSCC
ncbi:MAG: arsenite efflux transporter metallochaperone ArsD [Pararhodobacter sp.]